MLPDLSLLTLLAFIGLNFLASTSGQFFRPGPWYDALNKPGWTPRKWVFPTVWSILYLLNAISGAIVWDAAPEARGAIFAVYGASLVFNALWSAIFFGMKRMGAALIEVGMLWLSVAAVAIVFAPVSLLAAALQLPYLVWVSLAALLNLQVVQLNPRVVARGGAAPS